MSRRFGFLFVALALVAGACNSGSGSDVTTASAAGSDTGSAPTDDGSGGSSAEESGSSDGSDDSSDSSGTTSSTAGSDSDEPAMAASSPIGAFFADDGGFEAALAEYTVRVEEAIVVCMAEQGFEFSRTTSRVNPIQERQNELSLRDWTTEYGYGISTSFDTIAQAQASDPNAEILFSLSAGEREIWIQTLAGEQGLEGLGDGVSSVPLEEQGCIGNALIATGGQEAIEGIETFGSAYEEGEEALFDRREMIDAVDSWARCMSEAGHPGYSALDDPEADIGDRFGDVTAPLSAAIDELDPEEGQALIAGDTLDIEDLPDLDVEALRALQAEELTVALADLDCYESVVAETYEPLRDEFETGLLETYSTEFEALRNIGS